MPATDRCGGCPHRAHKGACRAKGRSRCITLYDTDGTLMGTACGYRPPCPCGWRTCECGLPVAVGWVIGTKDGCLVIERGSANDPDGLLAVRVMPDGILGVRGPVEPGAALEAGEWRGREHAGDCAERLIA